MKASILVVEHEVEARETLGLKLIEAGYEVRFAEDGLRAVAATRAAVPSLIVLDLELPGLDGLDVCRILRADVATERTPLIMLSSRGSETDRVLGLELGADDYLTKPYTLRELVLRIQKLAARAKGRAEPTQWAWNDLQVDASRHEVKVAGRPVLLTATEFRLIETLGRRRGRVLSRAQLLQEVWGPDTSASSRTVDAHMRRLRDKIGSASACLETVRGAGYRFTTRADVPLQMERDARPSEQAEPAASSVLESAHLRMK